MERNISVSLVQTEIIWENRNDNLEMYSRLLDTIKEKTDLVILPEMFTTGFTMEPLKLAEEPGGQTTKWMREWAKLLGCVIAGSIISTENGRFYNRLIWMNPDGIYSCYDKRHLFRMGNEHLRYSPGNTRLITGLMGWGICPLICYDLRFPVWSKNRYSDSLWEYDLLIYVANWPAERNNIWTTLLKARAIENQAYVVGVNRVGTDGNNIGYSGNSMAIDPSGNIIGVCMEGKVEIKTIRLSGGELMDSRNKLGAGRDWDRFSLIV